MGDGDVHRGAGRALVAQGGGQPGAGQFLGRLGAGPVVAVGGELGVADAREAQAGHRPGGAVVEDVHVLQALEVALGLHRVVVAADPDVRGAEVLDRVQEAVLGGRAVVHRVAGVDDHVHLVLLHQRSDDLPARRVEVDVRHVQDPDRGGVRLVGGERGGDVVQLGHVRHQAGQFLLVDVELGDDAAGVADQGGRGGEQPGELGLQHGVRLPGRVRGAARGEQQGEGEPAGAEGAARPAVDREAERGGAGDDGDPGAHRQVEGAPGDVVGDLVLEPGEALGVVDQGLRALGVELVDVDVQADGRDMAVQAEGAQRRDIDLRAAGHGGPQRHGGVHRADRHPDIAHHQQAQPGAEQDDGGQAEGAGPGVRPGGQCDRRGGPAGAAAPGEAVRGLAGAVEDVQDSGGDAGHWARMPRPAGGYAGPPAAPHGGVAYPTMGLCWR
ncbi:hypothetical protein SFUMM280S_07306 [Streptomyces fumanus]